MNEYQERINNEIRITEEEIIQMKRSHEVIKQEIEEEINRQLTLINNEPLIGLEGIEILKEKTRNLNLLRKAIKDSFTSQFSAFLNEFKKHKLTISRNINNYISKNTHLSGIDFSKENYRIKEGLSRCLHEFRYDINMLKVISPRNIMISDSNSVEVQQVVNHQKEFADISVTTDEIQKDLKLSEYFRKWATHNMEIIKS